MDGNPVTIVKDGNLVTIDEDCLCKDDMVVFQAGEVVPADLRLVEAREVETDEFDITGEIMPVVKQIQEEDTFLFRGSRITRGAGKGIVVATGDQTEYGGALKQSWEQDNSRKIRLLKIEYFGLVLLLLPAFAFISSQSENELVVILIFLFVAAVLVGLQNYELFRYWILSTEARRLKRVGIQVRDPLALEQMHEIDTICFDKTGVLTARVLDVRDVYYADAALASNPLLKDGMPFDNTKLACALCHDVFIHEKLDQANPVDRALISFALKNGVNVKQELSQYERIYDKPFDSENRYMACGFKRNEQLYYFAKGDPSIILTLCDRYLTAMGDVSEANFEFWVKIKARVDTINQSGGTAIALAYTLNEHAQPPAAFIFLGLFHLENALQPGARQLIRGVSLEAKRAVLLTGDREETAGRVAVECGIANDSKIVLTGKMIAGMALDEVARQSEYCSVFARLLPSQKRLVITLLQRKDRLVAMVGDGPNDGIALKVADISISFVKNSSPIARRLSRIWINDVGDILRLIEASNRIKTQAEEIHTYRALLLVILLVSVYVWVFTLYYHIKLL